jgi:8-oxo-dGTP pyrophosphatase MutT (NUDIX family)
MEYRIAARAIVIDGDRLLLVKHRHPSTGETWWVPPGGGLEGEESLFDCARRETFEETGLHVDLDRIVYIREFVEPGFHQCAHFILCSSFSGTLTTENIVGKGIDEHFIKEARFLARAEIDQVTAYPEIFSGPFWDDLADGFPETRYLGIKRVAEAPYVQE